MLWINLISARCQKPCVKWLQRQQTTEDFCNIIQGIWQLAKVDSKQQHQIFIVCNKCYKLNTSISIQVNLCLSQLQSVIFDVVVHIKLWSCLGFNMWWTHNATRGHLYVYSVHLKTTPHYRICITANHAKFLRVDSQFVFPKLYIIMYIAVVIPVSYKHHYIQQQGLHTFLFAVLASSTIFACCKGRMFRAGASYFRLVQLLRALNCGECRGGLGACSPRKIFKIMHSEITSEVIFGPKKVLESPHL